MQGIVRAMRRVLTFPRRTHSALRTPPCGVRPASLTSPPRSAGLSFLRNAFVCAYVFTRDAGVPLIRSSRWSHEGGCMRLTRLLVVALCAFCALPLSSIADAAAPQAASRPIPEWLRDGIVYEVFPRAFSGKGDFNGVTAQLDQLKSLGV